jgi:spore maturation protein CgeB
MKLFVFGSSLTSSYWNGAATYYRGIYKQLHKLGYTITFAEPDIYQRQQHQDAGKIDYATIRIYQTPHDLDTVLAEACAADFIIKHSGVGADDVFLEQSILRCNANALTAFWDVDAPATLQRIEDDLSDPFRELIPQYDFIFTYGGGAPVIEHYLRLGAQVCVPIYNALDPETHYPVPADPELTCDLAFVGHRLPDREQRVEQFFFRAAELAPEFSFVLGGEGWGGKSLPQNVRWIGHVGIHDHNRVNCSARMVLNINRASMAKTGFSPPTRVFEAAGAGSCLITDEWAGIADFFTPYSEILVAADAQDIVSHMRRFSNTQAGKIGAAMRKHALLEHTYELRALQFHRVVQERLGGGDRSEFLAATAPSRLKTQISDIPHLGVQ